MKKVRKVISRVIGAIQIALGGSMSLLAYLVYVNAQIQDWLSISPSEVYLYMFLFLVFGVFSIISGSLLIQEKNFRG